MRMPVVKVLLVGLIAIQLFFHVVVESEWMVRFFMHAFVGVAFAQITIKLWSFILIRQNKAAATATFRSQLRAIFLFSLIGTLIGFIFGVGLESLGGSFGVALSFLAISPTSNKVDNQSARIARRKRLKRARR